MSATTTSSPSSGKGPLTIMWRYIIALVVLLIFVGAGGLGHLPFSKMSQDSWHGVVNLNFVKEDQKAANAPTLEDGIRLHNQAKVVKAHYDSQIDDYVQPCPFKYKEDGKGMRMNLSGCRVGSEFPLRSSNPWNPIVYEGHLYNFDDGKKLESDLEQEIGHGLEELLRRPVLLVLNSNPHNLAELLSPGTFKTQGDLKYVVDTKADYLEFTRK